MAADGNAGKNFFDVPFGTGSLKTPRGIYSLSHETGAPIVPLFLKLNKLKPFPSFTLLIGKEYQINDTPEKEIKKIESIIKWFYDRIEEQPYMWNKITK